MKAFCKYQNPTVWPSKLFFIWKHFAFLLYLIMIYLLFHYCHFLFNDFLCNFIPILHFQCQILLFFALRICLLVSSNISICLRLSSSVCLSFKNLISIFSDNRWHPLLSTFPVRAFQTRSAEGNPRRCPYS